MQCQLDSLNRISSLCQPGYTDAGSMLDGYSLPRQQPEGSESCNDWPSETCVARTAVVTTSMRVAQRLRTTKRSHSFRSVTRLHRRACTVAMHRVQDIDASTPPTEYSVAAHRSSRRSCPSRKHLKTTYLGWLVIRESCSVSTVVSWRQAEPPRYRTSL